MFEHITHFYNELLQIGVKDLWIILAILIMDAALSADNSVAINALAMNVTEKLRGPVIWFGLVLAAILRVIALAFAAFIIANPWVQVLGAFYLIYLCVAHFRSKSEEEDSGKPRATAGFWITLASIGFLDLSLSTDNVIAVVALSKNFAVITLGVLASIAMLAVAAQVVRKLMVKLPSLEDAAYIILLFLGAIMLIGHTDETIVWVGQKCNLSFITTAKDSIMQYHYHVGETLEIICVGIILAGAVVYDRFIKSKTETV